MVTPRPVSRWLIAGLFLVPAVVHGGTGQSAPDRIDFNADIRPILSRRCFLCHGPDVSTRKAGLRLDLRKEAVAPRGESGNSPIVPGDSDASLLIRKIASYDDDFRMPPDNRPRLQPREIELLGRWIDQGAPYQVSWAWAPIRDVEPPGVEGTGDHPVDRFILARLRDQGLAPAGAADRRTLIRRLSFNLIGLPPTPEEVDAFLAEDTPDAWERVVDRLLDSPRYGERWARHWLDLVRYAETHGHEFDYPIRHAWQYRDYVVRALNADVPYDHFITEHIAGDLLKIPRRHPTEGYDESIIGTGFWFLSQGRHGPVDVRGDEAERIANQIDVLSKAFLGVTVGCARCHDHKFDPITTRDFYSLAGFLQSSRRQEAYLDSNGRIARRTQELNRVLRAADAVAIAMTPPRAQALARYADSAAEALRAAGSPPEAEGEEAQKAAAKAGRLAIVEAVADVATARDLDRELLLRWANAMPAPSVSPPVSAAPGPFESFDSYDDWFVTGHAFGMRPTGPRQLAARADGAQLVVPGTAHSGWLGNRLQGTLRSATFELPSEAIVYRLSGRGGRIRLIIDGYFLDEYNSLLFRGMTFNVNTGEDAWIEHRQSVGLYAGHRAHIEIIDDGDGFIAVDAIHLVDGAAANEAALPPAAPDASPDLDERVRAALAHWRAGANTVDETALVNWLLRHDLLTLGDPGSAEMRELDSLMARASRLDRELPSPMRVLAITDGTAEDEQVFVRGNHRTLGGVAPRRFIGSLAGEQPAITDGSGRLDLAQRLLSPDNPLPPRVLVNRVWHHLFGEGIVPTPDDFGGLGRPPSHPEMLDWLASWFRNEADWSIKRLIRLLVTSKTYRMSSTSPDPRAGEIDPTNRLLHRARIRRLEAEAIRDAILMVSGRFESTMYGPPVPVALTPFMTGRGRPAESGPRDGDGRRSIYIAVRRNFRSPMMTVFDAPVPSSTIGRRTRSNVPAQALMMMNDPFVSMQAGWWAARGLEPPGQPVAECVEFMYRQAYARPPTAEERAVALEFLGRESTDRTAEAALTDLAHILLNTKEFMFIP